MVRGWFFAELSLEVGLQSQQNGLATYVAIFLLRCGKKLVHTTTLLHRLAWSLHSLHRPLGAGLRIKHPMYQDNWLSHSTYTLPGPFNANEKGEVAYAAAKTRASYCFS